MTLQTKGLTYEEYLKGPEIKARYDIIDGEMIMAPAPTLRHQRMLGKLYILLHSHVAEYSLGEVFFAPFDMIIHKEPLRTRQPDFMYVSNERAGILADQVEGAPDLVVEILSPSNTRSQMEAKLADYARLGVQECWLVSQEAHTVEILELGEGNWTRISLHGLGDQVKSKVLSDLGLAVAEIFR